MILQTLISLKTTNKRMGYLKIADAIENMIINGTFKGNDRLPPTEKFMDIFKVSRLTIQRSLTRLSERGMVKRVPRRGTFVTTGLSSTTIGLISGSDPITIPSPYYRLLITAFHKLSNKYSIHFDNYIFMGKKSIIKNLINLEQDIKAGKLKSLIVISLTAEMNIWLKSHCSIPWINIVAPNIEDRVYKGVKQLCEYGYKNIKVLSLYDSSHYEAIEEEISAMLKAYEDCGCSGKTPELVVCGQNEDDGYNYLKKTFMEKNDIPDALLVNHDILTRGVIVATLELGIEIPNDLGIITHVNKGADILSPVKLDSFLVDTEEIAESTLNYINLNYDHLNCSNNICPYKSEAKFIKGSSTNKKELKNESEVLV